MVDGERRGALRVVQFQFRAGIRRMEDTVVGHAETRVDGQCCAPVKRGR